MFFFILDSNCGKKLSIAFCCIAIAFCCACVAQSPQAPAAPSPAQFGAIAPPDAPTFRITTREVLLDVLITDKAGQPVTGLKAADFHVTEEGEPQVIRRLDEHYPMSAANVEKLVSLPALPPNTFTNFTPVRNTNASIVLLLDAMDSPIGAQMAMRDQLIKYLKHLQPGPQIAIFQLDTSMHLIQGFTSDPRLLLAAAESKRDTPSLAVPSAAPRSYAADAVYRRALSDNLRAGMRMMGSYLAGFPGRKNLIWFTGQVPMTIMGSGFGNPFHDGFTVQPGSGNEATELTDVLTVSRVAVYPVDTRGLVAPLGDPTASMSRRGGMMNSSMGITNHFNMDEVAQQTGGKAYYNTNDFTHVIADVVNTGSSYYTLAYATTNTRWNGQLRRIKVSVDRPEVTLQHRQGYNAYNPANREQIQVAAIERRQGLPPAQPPAAEVQNVVAAPPAAPASGPDLGATVHHTANGGFGAAMGLGAIPPTEIVFDARLQADTSAEKLGKGAPLPPDNFLKPEWQHKPFRNYTVFFTADAHKIRLTRTSQGRRHGAVEFVAVVYTSNGEEVNSLINTARFDITTAQYRELLTSGLTQKMEIAIPVKGNYFLRLGVHDTTGDQVGALEIPVDQIKLGVAPAPDASPDRKP